MTERKEANNDLSPRSGRSENSPALQCWVQGELDDTEPVKGATEENHSIRVIRCIQPSAPRTLEPLRHLFPSDKSPGYFQPSAPRTIWISVVFLILIFVLANSSAAHV